MVPQTSSTSLVVAAVLRERRERLRVEALRDFVGVAAGVGAGALLWLGLLSLARWHG